MNRTCIQKSRLILYYLKHFNLKHVVVVVVVAAAVVVVVVAAAAVVVVVIVVVLAVTVYITNENTH